MQCADLPPYTVVRSQRDGMDTFRINLPGGATVRMAHRNDLINLRVRQLVAELQPDLAHLHCIQGLGAGVVQEIADAGIPCILSVHDYWWLCERQFMVRPDGTHCGQDPVDVNRCSGCVQVLQNTRDRQAYLFDAVARADLVTFPSAFCHGLSMRSGLPARRAVIWENGVVQPSADFFEAQAARRTRASGLTFGFVGGPSAVKGWPLIRAAFSRVKTHDFHGVVVDGSLDGSWWRPAMLAGLPGQWSIHPRYEHPHGLDRFFTSIDVLLFVSQWREAFGLAVREAICRGVRVIQTAGGGATEHTTAARTLPIGAGPDALSALLDAELSRPHDHPDPIPCRDFDAQARDLLHLIETL